MPRAQLIVANNYFSNAVDDVSLEMYLIPTLVWREICAVSPGPGLCI